MTREEFLAEMQAQGWTTINDRLISGQIVTALEAAGLAPWLESEPPPEPAAGREEQARHLKRVYSGPDFDADADWPVDGSDWLRVRDEAARMFAPPPGLDAGLREEVVSALREIEWLWHTPSDDFRCLFCGREKPKHEAVCRLAALLTRLEAAPPAAPEPEPHSKPHITLPAAVIRKRNKDRSLYLAKLAHDAENRNFKAEAGFNGVTWEELMPPVQTAKIAGAEAVAATVRAEQAADHAALQSLYDDLHQEAQRLERERDEARAEAAAYRSHVEALYVAPLLEWVRLAAPDPAAIEGAIKGSGGIEHGAAMRELIRQAMGAAQAHRLGFEAAREAAADYCERVNYHARTLHEERFLKGVASAIRRLAPPSAGPDEGRKGA